jgi:hypothetical protein
VTVHAFANDSLARGPAPLTLNPLDRYYNYLDALNILTLASASHQ